MLLQYWNKKLFETFLFCVIHFIVVQKTPRSRITLPEDLVIPKCLWLCFESRNLPDKWENNITWKSKQMFHTIGSLLWSIDSKFTRFVDWKHSKEYIAWKPSCVGFLMQTISPFCPIPLSTYRKKPLTFQFCLQRILNTGKLFRNTLCYDFTYGIKQNSLAIFPCIANWRQLPLSHFTGTKRIYFVVRWTWCKDTLLFFLAPWKTWIKRKDNESLVSVVKKVGEQEWVACELVNPHRSKENLFKRFH